MGERKERSLKKTLVSGGCPLGVARMRDRARHHVLVIARRQKKEAPPEGFGAWGLSFFWRHALVWMVLFCCNYSKKTVTLSGYATIFF
ncbi:hypothetical protein B0A58_05865 [Flavobacterium branchiophilum NBRC 15030 = ATCC 35035]|nr:hypothetical protein B0A58_05865 [Flavobacterium branchiophilum NBRC 15030 = ATCC 35035]